MLVSVNAVTNPDVSKTNCETGHNNGANTHRLNIK